MPYEKNPDEIGALWIKRSKNGVEFMSGTINGVDVVCFRSKGTSERAPAWNVLRSKPRDEMASPPSGTYNANARNEEPPF